MAAPCSLSAGKHACISCYVSVAAAYAQISQVRALTMAVGAPALPWHSAQPDDGKHAYDDEFGKCSIQQGFTTEHSFSVFMLGVRKSSCAVL